MLIPMKLRRGQKISYGVGDSAASLSYTVINTFLLLFLVQVVGLAPWAAGFVVIVGRLVDAVSDPVMGWWLDRRQQHTRWMLWGMLPFGLSFIAMWSLELFALPATTLMLVATLLFSVHTLAFTFVQVPYTALTPRLAPDYHGRTQLTAYRVAFGTFASLLGVALPPLLVESLGGWYAMASVLALLMVAAYAICIFGTRQQVRTLAPASPTSSTKDTGRLSLWQRWREDSRSRGFMPLLMIFSAITLGLAVVTSMLPFFLRQLSLEPWQETLVLGLIFVIGILSLPLWTRLSQRYGKVRALLFALLWLSVVLPLLIFTAPSAGLSSWLLLCVVMAGVPVGALLLFPWSMLPDVLEFSQYATGRRPEGSLYALFTFWQKVANALAIGLNALILSVVRYDKTLVLQLPSTFAGMRWAIGGIAVGFFLLACFVLWRYPITPQSHKNMREQLQD